ncbi:MAG: DNA polymerase III subunit chi [Gammaproteobacteria bacterium]|nr:DNA polymerase III subunit chi [Gammaproteobacteria bacterium]MCB1923788.1 DNA polymerase III subunit chi [Gammaproteobacteria bacterium]
MTQIDFYILDEQATGDRYQLACRVAERALRAGKRVLIHTPSPGEARHLDQLLWTLWEAAFVPHGLLGRDEHECNPILIGDGGSDNEEHDVLINLAPEIPTFFGRFQRLIECVDHDDTVKSASRERFRYYREHGYPLSTHTIT